jgi:ABC-type multidrug transport system fused ATPase/permease subunit
MKDRTVLVIAHRLSTVRDADVIVVFSKRGGGQIADAAPHDVLLSRCEEYRNLVQRQLQKANESDKTLEAQDGEESS